eukprot:scaffold46745_cov63-Phaeocystis_antarctica.AAC.2
MQRELILHTLLPAGAAGRAAGRAVLRGELVELLYLRLHLRHPIIARRDDGSHEVARRRRQREVEQVRLPPQGHRRAGRLRLMS